MTYSEERDSDPGADDDCSTDAIRDPPRLVACSVDAPWIELGQFAEWTERLLKSLVQVHPVFHGLYLTGNSEKDSLLLAEDLSNLRSWVLKRSWHENAPSNFPYSHRNADGSLSSRSKGRMGFRIDVGNLQPPAYQVWLVISDGSVSISLPPRRAPELCAIGVVRQMLQLSVDLWPVRCAFLTTSAWHKIVNPRAHDWLDLPIGGVTYSSDGTLVEALPPGTAWEPFGRGGILINVTERPDRLDPRETAAAIGVRDSLAAHGLLRLRNASA